MKTLKAIDLFCGAGGLTKGLSNSGITVVLGIDNDSDCKYAYEHNNDSTFLEKSVFDVSADEIKEYVSSEDVLVLAGCAPCQTFSTYNRKADKTDQRWSLLKEFERLIIETKPQIVSMENVPSLRRHKVFSEFVNTLKEQNYHYDYAVLNSADFGIPQARKRLVLLASKLGNISLPTPTLQNGERATVRDTISQLPSLNAGETDSTDLLHTCMALSDINLKRIKNSKPGGSWRDWRDELLTECHKKDSGQTYPSVYGRMNWDDPSPTITTQFFGYGNGRFGHPEQNRAISLREGALLQTFPLDYEFIEPNKPIYKKLVGKLIGNAVPVKLGEVIGETIISHISVVITS